MRLKSKILVFSLSLFFGTFFIQSSVSAIYYFCYDSIELAHKGCTGPVSPAFVRQLGLGECESKCGGYNSAECYDNSEKAECSIDYTTFSRGLDEQKKINIDAEYEKTKHLLTGGVSGDTFCFCNTDVVNITHKNPSSHKASCIGVDAGEGQCKTTIQTGYDDCPGEMTKGDCEQEKKVWEAHVKQKLGELGIEDRAALSSAFIPECALRDNLTDTCRDVSIFVFMLINIGRYLFGFVGSLVIFMLVLGGFQLIISQGNPEKIKKAKDIMVGAIIGLVVVFGAYMLVDFLGDTLGVQDAIDINESTSQN